MSSGLRTGSGPFQVDQIAEGGRYELSDGHPVECLPAGGHHASSSTGGAEVLDTDPDVEWTGVDAGYAPDDKTLRAPDVAIGTPADNQPGWIPGAPPLALEYTGPGQNEAELQNKIKDLLDAGTRYIWVARLVGPRRVEIYEPDKPVQTKNADEDLHAPGVLRNPVPVLALFDRSKAHQVTFRNLLQRHGYNDLDAVRQEGREEGRASEAAESVLTLLAARGLAISDDERARIATCRDLGRLRSWLLRAAMATEAEALFADP